MKIKLLLSASLLFFFSAKSLAQDNNCDVRQLQVSTYDFVFKNLDSIKKYTPKADLITAALELSENGKLTKIGYYTAYGKKEQKEVKIWKGLETFVKANFSRCPDSHFYSGREHVLQAVFPLPLIKENITKAKKEVESGANYITEGTGKTNVPADSKFTVALKSFTIKSSRGGMPYNIKVDPVTKEGTMDYLRSKMVKLSDVFTIAFEVVKIKEANYLKYTVYEKVDNKSQTVTREGWRPIVNSKANLSVKGIRDSHPGVKHINEGEEFEFDIDIAFSK
jgi:hypothetical protein